MSRIADFLDRLMRRKVPASVFVTMNPQMQAVRIAVRENGRQSFEDYIREQVAACSRSSVVPDHTLLHLTFPDSKAIPSRRSTTNEYFYGKLAPAFIRQDIHPNRPFRSGMRLSHSRKVFRPSLRQGGGNS